MVDSSPSDAVCLLENRIAEKVGPQRFKIWFKNATRFTLADGFLKVGVPNIFVGSWIENHFDETIGKVAEEVVGRKVTVAYSIDAGLARTLRKKQPDSQVEYVAANPERMARHQKRRGVPLPLPPLRGHFKDFVIGRSNRLAYSSAVSVAEQPGTQFNPLFIHGGCGLGKTHLLQAICNYLKENRADLRWVYLTGEDFTNQFVYSVKTGEREAFRQRYRMLDVLVIDDVHFLANKRATQEEFLHTFNAIDAVGKQVVLASDAHPKMIGRFSESLITRFVSGMVVRIDSPDQDTRLGVLRRRAATLAVEVSDVVLAYIAEHCPANVRELEGALLKLVALAHVAKEPITLELAKTGLRDVIQQTVPIIRLSDIESIVSIYFGLSPADLHTSRKTRTIALARSVAMYLARQHTNMSFPEIGRFMGNKNHATVILASRRIAKTLAEDGTVRWTTPSGDRSMHLGTLLADIDEQLGKSNRNGVASR